MKLTIQGGKIVGKSGQNYFYVFLQTEVSSFLWSMADTFSIEIFKYFSKRRFVAQIRINTGSSISLLYTTALLVLSSAKF